MLNSINLMGRFTQNPELKKTQSAKSVVKFTLAVERSRAAPNTEKREVDWIECVAWGQTAEFICKYFKKADAIIVAGRLETRQYEDKQGNNKKVYEVIVREVNFAAYAKKEQSTTQKATDDDIELLDDSDLPFL